MKSYKWVKYFILYNWILCVLPFILCESDILWLRIVTGIVFVAWFLVCILSAIAFLQSSVARNWCDNAEKIADLEQKAKDEWKNVRNIIDIIGEHEAVKLYKAKKQENEIQSTKVGL